METRHFPPEPRSVADARRWLRHHVRVWGRDDLSDAAELCLSEVLSNALRVTTGELKVVAMARDDRVRVEVHDELGSARPAPTRAAPLAECGRGLAIVSALAKEWGLTLKDSGKAVWFEVA